jgi:hypothetical protein
MAGRTSRRAHPACGNTEGKVMTDEQIGAYDAEIARHANLWLV